MERDPHPGSRGRCDEWLDPAAVPRLIIAWTACERLAEQSRRVCDNQWRTMPLFQLVTIALGVSADAFAVAVSQGLALQRFMRSGALKIAFTFAFFQMFMPVIGWLFGSQLGGLFSSYSTWVAAGLLVLVGGHMLIEAIREGDDDGDTPVQLSWAKLLTLGVATSIDAFAVGVSLSLMDAPLVLAVALIGIATFSISYLGVYLGHRVGSRFQRPAEIAGGVVLIAIAIWFILE